MASSGSALTVIESARISSIIEEALEKLSFLASITPDVMAHRDELSQIVGDEITRIIQEQRGLELRYEELIAQRASLKALSNKATAAPTPNCCVPLVDFFFVSGTFFTVFLLGEVPPDKIFQTNRRGTLGPSLR